MKKASRISSRHIGLITALMMLVLFACTFVTSNAFDRWWILLTFAGALFITSLIIALMLLPIEDNADERWKAIRVFYRFLAGRAQPMALIRDGKIIAQSDRALTTERGFIVTDSTSVVALRTSTGISRVEGAFIDSAGQAHSGVIFTAPEEEIDTVIDLRPQLRRKPTTAQTRDGITVDVAVLAFFGPRFTQARSLKELHCLKHHRPPSPDVKRGRSPVHYPPPFAWRRASMIQALSTRRVERAGEHTYKTEWYDRIMEIAIPRLRDLISEYTVDELTAWNTTDRFPKHPRYVIRDELVKLVKKEIDANDDLRRPTGIDLRFMSVSPPMPPEQVILRRIQAWSEEWRKKEAEVFARADAEAIRTRELARAQVQGEMTARINDLLEEARAAHGMGSDLVMLRFLEAMEKMSKDPTTRALLTFDALRMLKQLRELLTLS